MFNPFHPLASAYQIGIVQNPPVFGAAFCPGLNGSTGTASDIRRGHGMCDGHGTPWTSSITTQTWGSKMTTRMRTPGMGNL